MKIVVENGESRVEFRKGEETALLTAHRLCGELNDWLHNPDAAEAGANLARLIEAYCPPKKQEVKA